MIIRSLDLVQRLIDRLGLGSEILASSIMEPTVPLGFRFADLPQDVGRLIFRVTAELDEESGRSCALVSKEINLWCVL